MVRFKPGGTPQRIVPQEAKWINSPFVGSQIPKGQRGWRPIASISVEPGVGYRIIGTFGTTSRTDYNEFVMDTTGRLVISAALNSPRKWTPASQYAGRGVTNFIVHSRLPDGKYLVILNRNIMRYLADGRVDPSFISTYSSGSQLGTLGSWADDSYRFATLGDRLFYAITPAIRARTIDYLTGISDFDEKFNKTGLMSFQLRSVPGDYAYAHGRVTTVNAPQTGCSPAGPSRSLANQILRATPGNNLAMTDTAGYFSLPLPQGNYQLGQPLENNALMRQVCPSAAAPNYSVSLTASGQLATGNDFINQTYDCPRLYLGQVSPRFRMCSRGQIALHYGNDGTAAEPNARIRLNLPKAVRLLSASMAYSRPADSSYLFTLGNLAPGQSGQILIQDTVACWGAIDSSSRACYSARIEPLNVCGQLNPTQIGWSGAWLDAKAKFEDVAGGRVRCVVYARGSQMTDSVEYRYSAVGINLRGKLLLNAGDSLVITAPILASNHGFFLSLNQPAKCPLGQTGQLGLHGQSTAPVWLGFSSGWFEAQTVQACPAYRYSYDPNEKEVTPEGVVSNNAELTYTIHFENLGNDTAFAVAIEDTLSASLDAATFKLAGSSHPCRPLLAGTAEQPTVTFLFNPIALPARKQDSVNSKGQVSFKIKMRPGLPHATHVANRAHIYFDKNPAVTTNTVVSRLPDAPVAIRSKTQTGSRLRAWPNPSQGALTVALPAGIRAQDLRITNAQGAVVKASLTGKPGLACISGLPPGVYIVSAKGAAPVTVVIIP